MTVTTYKEIVWSVEVDIYVLKLPQCISSG